MASLQHDLIEKNKTFW